MNSVLFSSLFVLCFSWASCLTTPRPTPPAPVPNVWVLLVAGSNGWHNYRHQADICRAYQLFKSGGIPETNIVLMMYDDIANNLRNPFPGAIYESSGGPNVYEGVVKDYTGENVTPDNFLNVLLGRKELMRGIGSGKVIESGPNDYIFVNFIGHGSDDVLTFLEKSILSSNRLLHSLDELTSNKRFAKMFIFVDAEESSSIFNEVLEDNTNIFVMTSSDSMESSASGAEDFNETIGVFLTNEFSKHWMNTVQLFGENFTFHLVFQYTRRQTTASHVQEFGDLDIGNTEVAEVFKKHKSSTAVHPNLQRKNAVLQAEVKLATLD